MFQCFLFFIQNLIKCPNTDKNDTLTQLYTITMIYSHICIFIICLISFIFLIILLSITSLIFFYFILYILFLNFSLVNVKCEQNIICCVFPTHSGFDVTKSKCKSKSIPSRMPLPHTTYNLESTNKSTYLPRGLRLHV